MGQVSDVCLFSISDFLGTSHLTSAMRDFQVMSSRGEGRLLVCFTIEYRDSRLSSSGEEKLNKFKELTYNQLLFFLFF